jgi:hypothetical protein
MRKNDEGEFAEEEQFDHDILTGSPNKKHTAIHLERADDRENTVKSRGRREGQDERPRRISQVLDFDGVSEEEDSPRSHRPKRRQRRKSMFEEDDQLEVDGSECAWNGSAG